MRRNLVGLFLLLALFPVGALSTGAGAESDSGAPPPPVKPACPGPATSGFARCFADAFEGDGPKPPPPPPPPPPPNPPPPTNAPAGYGPSAIQSAYKLPGLATGAAPTVAIVDAYNDPYAGPDLNVYRTRFKLPACTLNNGCFRKVNQRGLATSFPIKNAGWAAEISLDLDAVSAACPTCHILLVEADDNSDANLNAAVDYAASQHVAAISNSWGSDEFVGETLEDPHFNHPGIAVTASTGDSGYGVAYPAASPYVISVGGTTLSRDTSTSRGWTERAWSGAGSGCSTMEPKPKWQSDSCANRSVADVSAVADPGTGLAIYDSVALGGASGWQVYGGTSLSSPLIAAVYALGGNLGGTPATFTYGHAANLFDVTTGSNGSCLTYLCTAGAGYDGPTGLGTPNGLAAF